MRFKLNRTASLALAYYYALGYGKLGFVLRGWTGASPRWEYPIVCTHLWGRVYTCPEKDKLNAFYTILTPGRIMMNITFTGQKPSHYWLMRLLCRFSPWITLIQNPEVTTIEFRNDDRADFSSFCCYKLTPVGWRRVADQEAA